MRTATSLPLVALIGNPNTGKTSVYNMLTGARHRVGNYPGITVETSTGVVAGAFAVLDLPGTYSLAARSPDEMIVADILSGRRRDVEKLAAAIVVLDASNLDRNLFLATQVLETGVPVVLALNMTDVARRNGMQIDVERLSAELGTVVVPLQARSGEGRGALIEAVSRQIGRQTKVAEFDWPAVFVSEAEAFKERLQVALPASACPPAYEVRRCLLDVGGYAEERLREAGDGEVAAWLAEHRGRIEQAGHQLPCLESETRYAWIGRVTDVCVRWDNPDRRRRSEAVDNWLTHRVLGTAIFVVVMGAVFISVFHWAAPLMGGISQAFDAVGEFIHARLGEGVLASFLADGLVEGVGGVLVFLPQILILFAFITILEDCGYLARAAFLMDRLMRLFGLGGRSFVPLLSSFACAIPGIMAARTVENRRDRLVTILLAPLMSCSARIPIYALLVAAFVSPRMVLGFLPLQGLVFTAMYFVGIVAAAVTALILKHTILPGEDAPFLLELPSYKMPSLRTIVLRMYDRGKDFVLTAGTIILALSVIIWALLYFPRPAALEAEVRAAQIERGVTEEAELDRAVAGAYLRQSYLGRCGQAIEPVVKPLGWDWKLGTAALAAFPAREVVISTLGIIYNLGEDEDEASKGLPDKLREATWPDGSRVLTLPTALSLMVFFALCCQCQATIAVMRRETNTWRWPIFAFIYFTAIGYLGAMIVYQVGSRWG